MNSRIDNPNTHDFLRDGGLMGELMRAFDWTSNPVGTPSSWPLPLRTAVRIMLSTNHPVFIWWGPSLICFYNDAYSRSIGLEKHPSILGMPAWEAWSEIWHIISPQIEFVMEGKGSTWNEDHLVPINRHGKKSDPVYWTYSYSPIDDATALNGVGGVLVLCNETTDRVLAAAHERRTQERWRQLFDQSPGFMCVLSGENHIFEFANPAYYELIKLDDVIGKSVKEVLPWALEQGFVTLLDEVYKSGQPFRADAIPLVVREKNRAVSSERYLDFVYQPIRNNEDSVIGIFVLGSDVTERIRTQQQLKEMAERKDVFLATLAHELRNPLAPIQTGIDVLVNSAGDPVVCTNSLDMMQRQVTHLVRLVDDLLDVSRINQGKINLHLRRADVRNVVQLAIEASRACIYADGRHVTINLPHQPLYIQGDSVRLVQVISNLLNNAGKFTQPCGNIDITVTTESKSAKILITDDGIGIASDMLGKLFDMFVQVPAKSSGGLGIGLALVKNLIELHGGRTQAFSDGLGKGSEFVVHIPLSTDTCLDQPVNVSEDFEQACWHKKILVVDDNVDAAESLRMLFSLMEAEVRMEHDGMAALAAADKFLPDAIFLDLDMPGMSGYEVAKAVRSVPRFASIKLIALTGWGEQDAKARVVDAGFDHHLVKPVNLSKLQEIMQGISSGEI